MPTPNIEDMSANLTLIATKLKKRNKLVKLADRSPVGRSIVQEYEQEPMAGDSDDAQKVREAEQRAIRKRKVKTPASFTQSSSSTISKAPGFQFWNASFQNEFKFTNQENYISVKGTLRQSQSFWKNTIKANYTVLNIIQGDCHFWRPQVQLDPVITSLQ